MEIAEPAKQGGNERTPTTNAYRRLRTSGRTGRRRQSGSAPGRRASGRFGRRAPGCAAAGTAPEASRLCWLIMMLRRNAWVWARLFVPHRVRPIATLLLPYQPRVPKAASQTKTTTTLRWLLGSSSTKTTMTTQTTMTMTIARRRVPNRLRAKRRRTCRGAAVAPT